MVDPNITDEDIILIGTRYHIRVDPDNATHYKLCQVINSLEQKLKSYGVDVPDFTVEKDDA